MSVHELTLRTSELTSLFIKYETNTEKFRLRVADDRSSTAVTFNCNQAHLLMLFLQEHLGKREISKGLDEAISAELADKPDSIMGPG